MTTQVKSWGNSKAVRLPSELIQKTGLQEDDHLEIYTDGENIILSRDAERRSFETRIMEYAGKMYSLQDIAIDDTVKNTAAAVCREMGLSLQTAVNIFLVKLSVEKKIPFEISVGISDSKDRWTDTSFLYPDGFFDLFGSGGDLGMDDEPEELAYEDDRRLESL